MSFDAYKIAIRLSLINNVSSGLLGLSTQFTKVHNDAQLVQKDLDKIKLTMLKGAALVGVGAFGLGMIGKTIGPAKEYAHQLALMNTAGMKHLEIVKATNAAWDAAKVVPTSSASENLASVRELRMVFGDTGHAIENMPVVQQLQAILRDVKGGKSGGRDEAYEVAKALELKGAVRTPEEFRVQADMMAKAIVASGGKVGATDFLGTFKYGRSATAGWSDAFSYTILPTLIQEMKTAGGSSGGAGGPGNALMSAYAAVVGGTIPQKSLKIWQKIGMLDPSKIVYDKVGSAKGVHPGGIMGSDEFQSNPYLWVQKFLVPALQKAGYKTAEQEKQALQYLFPNRTAGFVMTQMATQGWKFERDRKLIGEAQGLGAYQQLLKNDPEMAQMALHKQWESLLAILGYQIMPVLIKGMLALIDVMRGLAHWIKEYPGLAKTLMYALGGLSLAMAMGGSVLLLKGAFMGLQLVMGVTGGAGLIGKIGSLAMSLAGSKLGLAGAAAFAVIEVGRLGLALLDLWNANHHDGVKLTPDQQARLDDPATQAKLKALDADFVKPRAQNGADTSRPVQLVLRDGGRVLADVVSTHQAKNIFGVSSNGSFDLAIAQPSVNLRTN